MTSIVAQTAFERLVEGDWWAVTEPYWITMGDLFVGLVGATVLVALYINSDSLAIPAVVGMIGGGVAAEYAPAPVQRGAFGVIFLGITLFGAYLYIERRGPNY